MKIERKEKIELFRPVTVTLETQEEFDFLIGLANGGKTLQKEDCDNYNWSVDENLWRALRNVQ